MTADCTFVNRALWSSAAALRIAEAETPCWRHKKLPVRLLRWNREVGERGGFRCAVGAVCPTGMQTVVMTCDDV